MPIDLPRRRARPAFGLAALSLALALSGSPAVRAQDTDPSPLRPPTSQLGTDGEGRRDLPGAAMHHRAANGSVDLRAAAMRSIERMQSLRYSGDTDRDFAALMRAQQRHALEMARIELQHGRDPQLRRLAEQFVATQEEQLATLERWLEAHPPTSRTVNPPPRP